jgi:hypothetical protein
MTDPRDLYLAEEYLIRHPDVLGDLVKLAKDEGLPKLDRREPRIYEMAPSGDLRRFLCVMEIEPNKITGGTFTITARNEYDTLAWCHGLASAWASALDKAEREEWVPESSTWEAFK